MNLDVNKIKSPALSLIVAVVAAAPELANPSTAAAAISRLSSAVSGRVLGKSSGGLSDDVSKSPIDIISARGSATNGIVKLDQTVVRSTVFEADVTDGDVGAGVDQFGDQFPGEHFVEPVHCAEEWPGQCRFHECGWVC